MLAARSSPHRTASVAAALWLEAPTGKAHRAAGLAREAKYLPSTTSDNGRDQ